MRIIWWRISRPTTPTNPIQWDKSWTVESGNMVLHEQNIPIPLKDTDQAPPKVALLERFLKWSDKDANP